MKFKSFLEKESLIVSKNGQISLDDTNSGALLSYFLRAVRGRHDLSKIVNQIGSGQDEFIESLEKIRNELRNGNLLQALELIQKTKPANELESHELILELTRFHYFSQNWNEVLEFSKQAIHSKNLPLTTRMTLNQLRGAAAAKAGLYPLALEELNSAISLANLFPRAQSGFVAHSVLAYTYVSMGKRPEAQQVLEDMEIILSKVTSLEEWAEKKVHHLRALSHYELNQGDKNERLLILQECLSLANWLELVTTERLCLQELEGVEDLPSGAVIKKQSWSYLPRLKIIICRTPKSIHHLGGSDVTCRLLEVLLEGSFHQNELLEKIWGLKALPKYHNHLRSILSKLRSKLPPGALKVKDQIVTLK